MLKVRLVSLAACAMLALSPARAFAQTSSSSNLVDLMKDFFLQSVVLSTTPGGGGVVAHTPVFANDPSVTPVTDLIQQISSQIGSQVANVPLGSSSGGFTYKYDSSLGTFKRSTESFGPAFAERAVTIGKGKMSFGMNYQHSSYPTLDGKNLAGGDIAIYLPHQKIGSFVEGDMIESDLKMDLTSDAAVFFGNFGLTDKLDLGVVLPIEHVNMNLTYHAVIRDFATHVVSPTTHLFANGQKTQDTNTSASASGIGDIVVRGKYLFMSKETSGIGVGLDLRLPSGDADNMLGTGATQTQIYLIASGVRGKFGDHVNIGYTVSSGGTDVSDQFNYVGGAEYAVTPKLTVVGDLVGRTFIDSKKLSDTSFQHSFQQGATAPVETVTLQTVQLESANINSVLGTAGFKFNAVGNLLVNAHIVVTLNDSGLHRGVTGVFGFDYSF
jgi:hypothetical protein